MTEKRSRKPDTSGIRLGVFWLTPGISRTNALTLIMGGFSTICVLTFMNFLQPFILAEILHIPDEQQGALSGWLVSLHEIVVILTVGIFGALSDRTGRRLIWVLGALIMSLGFLVFPTAGSANQLIAFRLLYALGVAASGVMLHTCIAEYTQDATRGKWLGLMGIFNGLGVVFMALVLTKLPAWYTSTGFSDTDAIRNSYWTMAVALIVLAVIMHAGLQGPTNTEARKRQPLFRQIAQGFDAARENSRIALSFCMAFASRGDLVILTVFFPLWLFQAGTAAGMDAATAQVTAGKLFGLSQAAGLLWAFPMGMILDRLNRLTAMCIAFALASLGYLALGMISDPLGPFVIPACILIGVGESSAIVAAGTLIGQEAPATRRGAVLGTFSFAGAVGMTSLTFTGGQLFDLFSPTAPFLMMAMINSLVLAAALTMRFVWGHPGKSQAIIPGSAISPSSGDRFRLPGKSDRQP